MKEQSIGAGSYRSQDLPAQGEHGQKTAQILNAHAQIDHDEIRISGKVSSLTVNGHHRALRSRAVGPHKPRQRLVFLNVRDREVLPVNDDVGPGR
jgi:hypothetical protein